MTILQHKNKALKAVTMLTFLFSMWQPMSAAENFVDFGPAHKLIEVTVQGLGGGSSVTQNYQKIFPQIQNLNVNMGNSWGLGAKAVFGIRDYLGFGTALNVMLNHYNIDLTVVDADNSSMNAVFVNNRNFTINVPIFMSARFNVAYSVRWNVDFGMYYAYGFAGRQRQQIYRAEINAMDELVPELENVKTDYYHSPRTLFNVFNRGDIGLHLASSLNFGPHLMVGVQSQFGLKNSARQTQIDKSSVHNFSLLALIGYRF